MKLLFYPREFLAPSDIKISSHCFNQKGGYFLSVTDTDVVGPPGMS